MARGRTEFRSSLTSMQLAHLYDGLPADGTDTATYAVGSAAILRAHRLLTQRVEAALAPLGLTMARFEVLGRLNTSERGRMAFTELKRTTLLHAATMGHNVNRLEDAGLVQRRRDEADGRALYAEITPSGRALAEEATAALGSIRFGLAELDEPTTQLMCVLLSELGR